MILDEDLDVLAEYFIAAKLLQKNWQFHEFVAEYLAGNIAVYHFEISSKQVNVFTNLLNKLCWWK